MGNGASAIRILAIDDDADVLETLQETLGSPRFEVRTANSPERFYNELQMADPDFVITDLAMPSHDGMDVLRALRDRSYSGAIIVASGQDGHVLETVRRVAASYGLNVVGVLKKPFTPSELLAHLLPASDDQAARDTASNTAPPQRLVQYYFQPKVDIKSGRIVGADVLQRNSDTPSGRPIAKGFVHDLTSLERATEFGAKLQTLGEPVKTSVSFPAEVIMGNEFIAVVADAQKRHKIGPGRMIIGLAETGTMEPPTELAERLVKLRLLGLDLAIDDFGTGHSSLSRLQNLPVSEINIDRSFVTGLNAYSDNFAIVRSIVELGHSLGCSVLAKGVDTPEALAGLRALGCDMAQGLLFSPPLNESTFVALVRDNPFLAA